MVFRISETKLSCVHCVHAIIVLPFRGLVSRWWDLVDGGPTGPGLPMPSPGVAKLQTCPSCWCQAQLSETQQYPAGEKNPNWRWISDFILGSQGDDFQGSLLKNSSASNDSMLVFLTPSPFSTMPHTKNLHFPSTSRWTRGTVRQTCDTDLNWHLSKQAFKCVKAILNISKHDINQYHTYQSVYINIW